MQKNQQSIKKMILDDRPREKLLAYGASSLSNSELVAILMGSGTLNKNALELSKELMELGNGSINELARKNIKELTKISGVGVVKALNLNAAFELGKRRRIEQNQLVQLSSSQAVYDYVLPLVVDAVTEEFWVLALNKANKVLAAQKMSFGGVSSTLVDVKCIVKFCIEQLASAAVVFHNHPSGNSKASEADKKITYKLKQALQLCDVNLLDHLVVCQSSYFSFSDEGLLV